VQKTSLAGIQLSSASQSAERNTLFVPGSSPVDCKCRPASHISQSYGLGFGGLETPSSHICHYYSPPIPYLIHHAQRGVFPGYALTLLYAVLW
jgi:hypothetical protein